MVGTVFCQKCREEVPLCFGAAGAAMVALSKRFFLDSAPDTALRQFSAPGGNLLDRPASVCSFAGKLGDEHTGATDGDTSAEILLQRPVGKLLGFDDIPEAQDLVANLAMLFFPRGSKLALTFGDTSLAFPVALRAVPFPGAFP